MTVSRSCLAIVGLCLFAAGASAQYTVTVLHPSGYSWSLATAVSADTQAGWGLTMSGHIRPLVWQGSAASFIDLNPSGFDSSEVHGVSANTQVGWGFPIGSNFIHALLWNGSAATALDLHPAGYTESFARGVSGTIQVGEGSSSANANKQHALLWRGSAGSVVDLNPPGILRSVAYAAFGKAQVGYGSATASGANFHALLWNGTAASAIDLHPAGFTQSVAQAVSGANQAGSGFGPGTGNNSHALLWGGNAASAIDLHPSGFTVSAAVGLAENTQVGFGYGPGTGGPNLPHALRWNGSPGSVLDLHTFLTGLTVDGNPLTLNRSTALAIDGNGVIVGDGQDVNGNYYALLWKPVETVSGTVILQNFSASPAGAQVTIEIRSPGSTTPLETHSVTLDGNGNYSLTTSVSPGTYDIAAKGSHWLRQVLGSQTVGTFGMSSANFSLINGDVNGDNGVSLGDFAALRAAFGSSPGDGNWNPNADLNGDGGVSLGDFAILRSRFGDQGDP